MQKETIEISREKIPKGYGKFFCLSENSEEILNKLVEWSNNYMTPTKDGCLLAIREKPVIYKQQVRYEQGDETEEIYAYFQCGAKITKEEFDKLKSNKDCPFPPYAIPYCDLVCYLDIYYQ